MTSPPMRSQIGDGRVSDAAPSQRNLKLIAIGIVGGLMGGLYSTLPHTVLHDVATATILRIHVNMGDVEAISMEDLAETVIESHRRKEGAVP